MSVYSVVSSVLSYVFTTIIYLFIFSVIALIYMDIKKISRKEHKVSDNEEKETSVPAAKCFAVLRTVKTQKAKDAKMKAAYRIDGRGVIVGRGKECDICINHMFLSVEHFQVWCDDGFWYIGDMGSKNGTYLNGSKLRKVRELEDGDKISFGELSFVFEEEHE
ncbi:MAG: FHA domain-containing protein [Clostridia bacterium]|nr:FHA domain-containing protein [Clostridia bacterium]